MLSRIAGALGTALALAAAPATAAEREVQIPGGPGPLVGTLTTPDAASARPKPAVLLLAGSGAVNRDGASPQAGFFGNDLKLIAEALARAGYASLRTDKRCIGDSLLACPGEDKLTIETYADDAVAWAQWLKRQPAVGCVVLIGHSEGALLAALAANKAQACGVVSVSGAGRPLDQVVLEQFIRAGAGPVALGRLKAIQADLKAGRTVTDVPPALMGLYRPAIQPYARSEFAIDPAATLAAVQAPVLIEQGTSDLQVGVDDARRLAAAHPGAKLVLLEGVNHILKPTQLDRAANLATYARADLPLAPGVMPPILAFLQNLPSAR